MKHHHFKYFGMEVINANRLGKQGVRRVKLASLYQIRRQRYIDPTEGVPRVSVSTQSVSYRIFEYQKSPTELIRLYLPNLHIEVDKERGILPMDYSLRHLMTFRKKEPVYHLSPYIYNHVVVSVKSSWWSSLGFIFGAFLILASAIIFPPAAVTAGTGASTAFGAAASIGFGAAQSFALFANIAVGMTLHTIMSLSTRIGVIGKIIGVITAIYALRVSYSNAMASIAGNVPAMYADILVFAGRSGQFINSINGLKIEARSRAFARGAEKRSKELERLKRMYQETVNPSTRAPLWERPFSPIELGFITFGETPSEYVDRTVSVNLGYMALDFPRDYVQNTLRLPEISETVHNTILKGNE